MILINHAAREMTAKVVYYGPGLCGKTTNLIKLHEQLPAEKKGKMLSLATKQDRTLFFDLLPVEVGKIKGMKVRIQLYTVPGQVFYDETRRLVLKGADAVIFVVDSQTPMVDANRESFQNLLDNLEENGIDFNTLPFVIQYNKRDLPNVHPIEELIALLNFQDYPYQDAVAVDGEGVKETFQLVVQMLLQKLAAKPRWGKARAKPQKPETAPANDAVDEEPVLEVEEEEVIPEAAEPSPSALEDTSPGTTESPIDIQASHDYDKVEEVDLTQLIEERKRETVTITSDDEVLELSPDQIVEAMDPDEEVMEQSSPLMEDTAIRPPEISPPPIADEKDLDLILVEKLEALRDQLADIIDLLKQR